MVEDKTIKDDKIRQSVREAYSNKVNKFPTSNCCGSSKSIANEIPESKSCMSNGCGGDLDLSAEKKEQFMKRYGVQLGYTEEELNKIPKESNLGLGCGNPTALASIKLGEIVLDLGSGGGLDCFIAANKVGKTGKVIGVDMTPAMISKARENAVRGNYDNVEFRLGEIENLPVADNSVDIVISNCVINLSPDKEQVFREAFRVLKPRGRLMVSDIVLLKELPNAIKNNAKAYASCIGGAILKNNYLNAIERAGFRDVKVLQENNFSTTQFLLNNDDIRDALGEQIETLKEFEQLDIDSSSISVKATKH